MRSQHNFSQTPSVSVPRSTFNLSHGHKAAFDADDLIPICQPIDVIPGDTFRVNTNFFMRLATPLFPILDNLYFDSFAFFVPYRTIWINHEKFHGAQDDPGDSISFTIPVLSGGSSAEMALGKIADHFGIPPVTPDDINVSALPFRAYQKIYNDWFRSATLQDSLASTTGNGPDNINTTYGVLGYGDPLKRGKRFDYFTSCLPAPQRGTSVALPLGSKARVAIEDGASGGGELTIWDITNAAQYEMNAASATLQNTIVAGSSGADFEMFADLTGATSSTVNDIRLAFATQHVLERDARAGTRYVESLQARWGVTSPDFRLQRAEYLGGGTTPVNVNPVTVQASRDSLDDPATTDRFPGQLAAFGTASGNHSWTKSFVEHGVIIILGNLRGDISYSQGLDRYWSKQTRYEFVYPELANIGEQAVLQGEIWVTGGGSSADDEIVFGYQGRYDEHRFLNSKITGILRPDAATSLAAWHLSEDFASAPTLGNTFIKSNTAVPLDRAIAIPSEPHMIADFYHHIKAARPLPTFGVPGLTRL